MGLNEWRYNRLVKSLASDKKLIGFLHERMKKNRKKMIDIENSQTMVIVN